MQINEKTAHHIAKLARIYVDKAELSELAKELSQIVSFMEQLNEVDVENIPPMNTITSNALYQRKDEITEPNLQDKILQNAPDAREGFFTIPKVVE